jgi:hypothetical protein
MTTPELPPMPPEPPRDMSADRFDVFAPRRKPTATSEAPQFQYVDEPQTDSPEVTSADASTQATYTDEQWGAVLRGSADTHTFALKAYAERKNTTRKELPSYDEDSRPILSEAAESLKKVTPSMVITRIVKPKRWEEIRRAAANPSFHNWVNAAKSLLPDYVREETAAVGWTVTRTVGEAPAIADDTEAATDEGQASAPKPSLDMFTGQTGAGRARHEGDEASSEDDESDKTKELVVLTSDGMLLRFEGTDDTPEDADKPLRYAEVAAPDYGRTEKGKARADAARDKAQAYLERNESKFTTMQFVGAAALMKDGLRVQGMEHTLATPDRVSAGITALFENATGMKKVQD